MGILLPGRRERRGIAGHTAYYKPYVAKELPLFATPASPAPDALREALTGMDPDEPTPKAALEAHARAHVKMRA